MQKTWKVFRILSLTAALLSGSCGSAASAETTALGPGIAAELQSLTAHAATIFVGQITSIERKGSVVEITFRVEQPVAGRTGASCVLREWAGLWAPGQSRYTPGTRVLAFLHASDKGALSTPVHGVEGLIPVVVQGANAPQLLDIRRVASAVFRSPGTPLPGEADGGLTLSDVLPAIASQNWTALRNPTLVPLPVRGAKPGAMSAVLDPRYPVALPVKPQPRGPFKTPVLLGGRVEVR